MKGSLGSSKGQEATSKEKHRVEMVAVLTIGAIYA